MELEKDKIVKIDWAILKSQNLKKYAWETARCVKGPYKYNVFDNDLNIIII